MKIKFLAFFIVLYFVLFFGACRSEITIKIEGIVTDATNGSPIIGAKVELWKIGFYRLAHADTNQTGHYSLKYSEVGRCSEVLLYITASADGYMFEDYYSVGEPHVRCTNETQTINFQLEPY